MHSAPEWLSALDKKLRERTQGELRRPRRQVGITFSLVTHDQEGALIMSDLIGMMSDGVIAPDQIMRAPPAGGRRGRHPPRDAVDPVRR